MTPYWQSREPPSYKWISRVCGSLVTKGVGDGWVRGRGGVGGGIGCPFPTCHIVCCRNFCPLRLCYIIPPDLMLCDVRLLTFHFKVCFEPMKSRFDFRSYADLATFHIVNRCIGIWVYNLPCCLSSVMVIVCVDFL